MHSRGTIYYQLTTVLHSECTKRLAEIKVICSGTRINIVGRFQATCIAFKIVLSAATALTHWALHACRISRIGDN
jgi:hypothetical protein